MTRTRPTAGTRENLLQDVYEQDVKDCEEAKKNLRPEFKDLAYDCPRKPGDNPGNDVIYTFKVEGKPVLEVGKVYEFDSIPKRNFWQKDD